jgi:hypothetical protein
MTFECGQSGWPSSTRCEATEEQIDWEICSRLQYKVKHEKKKESSELIF